MCKLRGRGFSLFILMGMLSLFLLKNAMADTIKLRDGRTIEGTIVRETDSVVIIDMGLGKTAFAKKNIWSIKKQEPLQRETGAAKEGGASVEVVPHKQEAVSLTPQSGTGWRKDLSNVTIPNTVARGRIHGKPFICEKAEIQNGILKIRQGKDFFADLEVMIFLFLKKGETVENKVINVSDKNKSGVPHIHMKWKEKGESLPKTEMFMSGYYMTLKFGAVSKGRVPCRIYLSLPDKMKSYVAGKFDVAVSKTAKAAVSKTGGTSKPGKKTSFKMPKVGAKGQKILSLGKLNKGKQAGMKWGMIVGNLLVFVGGLANFIGGIILLVAAFQKSVGTGFLTLCIPFYILHFAFNQYKSEKKGRVILLWLGGIILSIIGGFVAFIVPLFSLFS